MYYVDYYVLWFLQKIFSKGTKIIVEASLFKLTTILSLNDKNETPHPLKFSVT